MKMYETKGVMKAFYYLIAADGHFEEAELERFKEIGLGLDPENFEGYMDDIVKECQNHLDLSEADEYYDIVQEGLDEALKHEPSEDDPCVIARLVVWDMLALAYSDGEYNEFEKKLISHVARISGVKKDVLLEMELGIQTAAALLEEKDFLENSGRSYGEIRPLVDDVEHRLETVENAARLLVEDEVLLDDPFLYEPDMIDKAMDAISEKGGVVAQKAKEVMEPIAAKTKEKVSPIADMMKDNVADPIAKKSKEVFGSVLDKFSKDKGIDGKSDQQKEEE